MCRPHPTVYCNSDTCNHQSTQWEYAPYERSQVSENRTHDAGLRPRSTAELWLHEHRSRARNVHSIRSNVSAHVTVSQYPMPCILFSLASFGADNGNWTRTFGLESRYSTVKSYLHMAISYQWGCHPKAFCISLTSYASNYALNRSYASFAHRSY